jgi:hypothetical protein
MGGDPTQEERIRRLRKRYPYYGKKKLKVLYEKENSEGISTWKIERVIRRHKLYPDQKRAEKTARKGGSPASSFSLIPLLSTGIILKDIS